MHLLITKKKLYCEFHFSFLNPFSKMSDDCISKVYSFSMIYFHINHRWEPIYCKDGQCWMKIVHMAAMYVSISHSFHYSLLITTHLFLSLLILSSLLGSPVPWSIWSCPVPQLSKGYQWIEWRGPYYSINYVQFPTHCHIEEWANGWRSGPGLPQQETLSSISPAHH